MGIHNLRSKTLSATAMILCLSGTCHQVLAQAEVVDAGSSRNSAASTQPAGGNNSQNEIMVEMYLRLEALQNEIQNLRGLVEEQSYEIRRMQTEQRDRYLDTDSRLSELFSYHSGQQPPQGAVNAGNQTTPATGAGNTPVPQQPGLAVPGNTASVNPGGVTTTGVQTGAAPASPMNEQELYRLALNQLLEEENFQDSANLFQQYIDTYPQGRYLTNSLYWQGAALHLLENYTQSISVLQRLLDEFPQDPKAPTAMLRLGTVFNEMGNRARAVEYWTRISQVYPTSTSEIELANEYLNGSGR